MFAGFIAFGPAAIHRATPALSASPRFIVAIITGRVIHALCRCQPPCVASPSGIDDLLTHNMAWRLGRLWRNDSRARQQIGPLK